jgi:hypothetical protein
MPWGYSRYVEYHEPRSSRHDPSACIAQDFSIARPLQKTKDRENYQAPRREKELEKLKMVQVNFGYRSANSDE